jgi:ubiquinone/menaquinone biosynthesis C-methylase UbiE
MPSETFWRKRYQQLGMHSVGPGDTQNDFELEEHRQYFVHALAPLLPQLKGPVLDFGCGVGRWVPDLPRPYLGLDLLPEHLVLCKKKYQTESQVEFGQSSDLAKLPDKSFKTIFTCTVLQHIVEKELRKNILGEFKRLLSKDGIFLSVEWADGQKEFDWCTAVHQYELTRWFSIRKAGEVIESGRKSNIWVGKPSKSFFRRD